LGLKFYLTAFVKALNFFAKRRSAKLAAEMTAFIAAREAREERERDRQHQLQLVEVVATKLVEFAKTNQEGILQLAAAQTAQAEILSTWMKGFQSPSTTPVESMPAAVDEWENPYGLVEPTAPDVQLPPEFKLAYSLKHDPNPDFDREGRDEF
jgi:hypothetical protein